jgi:Fe-S oxidoreductase/electron transfer flavoprotein alpha/beta subunit
LETRELFWSFGSTEIFIFYVFGVLAIAAFLYGVWKHLAKYRMANQSAHTPNLREGLTRVVRDLFSHRTLVRRDRQAGIAHAAVFFGFVIAFIGTSVITLDHDIFKPLFGFSYWKGDFYLLFSLVVDLGGLALLIGLLVMAWRRWKQRPKKLEYTRTYRGQDEPSALQKSWRFEDKAFLIILLVITVSGFLLEGLRLHTDKPDWAIWSPVGYSVALLYGAVGLPVEVASTLRLWGWWSHGILSLAFIAAIPWYKAKHIISVLGSLLLRDEKPLRRLPGEPDDADTSGVAILSDFTLKDMLDFDACTKCGRCHEVCPATATGYPLSPRDLILDLRTANTNAAAGATAVDLVIDDETLWSCLSCGACQEICPVGIEHPSKIVRMRRSLVDEGKIDPMLQTTFASLGDVGNSFGESPRKRSAWVDELDFPVKDIRSEPAQYLWFVGDYASFDPRNQKVSRTVARLLRAAGVDFALLHEGEHSAGNDIRRAGEEGLFSLLAEHNLAQMSAAHPFERILTTDPHSYNTIRNEYPEYQDIAEIEHYSTILATLLREGRLKVTKPLNRRVTFHDPCHLGRLNGGYDAPRDVLELIGCEIVEMPRNRDNSFCCGAGGGRIWMPDQPGEKPSENRMHEAADLVEIDSFITCCPKDLNMFEDANKTAEHSGSFTVDDLAELVADAVELDKLTTDDFPAIVKLIVEKSSEMITERVLDQLSSQMPTRLEQPAEPAQIAAPQNAPVPVEVAHDNAAPARVSLVATAHADMAPSPSAVPPEAAAAPEEAASENSTASPASAGPTVKDLRPMHWVQPVPIEAAEFPPYDMPERAARRILVAVRHVGVLNDGFQIADNRSLPVDSFDHKINEWDEAAMEEALLLSEKLGDCEVVAVTIGDESAEVSLRKAMAMGADRGVRIWDDSLQDSDPLTIARALAGIATLEQPDLFLCGVQSADLGHGSTGIALAGIMDVAHSAGVISCDWDGSEAITLIRELEGGAQHEFRISVPAVLTIQTGSNQPRYATMRMIKQAKKKPIEVVDGSSVDDGSSGFVIQRMYEPTTDQATMLDGGAKDVAAFIVAKIKETTGE